MTTKIAFPTDDGQTISRHFGRAAQFLVVTLQDGAETGRETREKPAHKGDHQHGPQDSSPVRLHEVLVDPAPDTAVAHTHGHGGMFEALADCQVLIAGGMGQPAYERAQAQGLEVYLPGDKEIERALAAYLAGTLQNDMRRVHAHGHDHDHG